MKFIRVTSYTGEIVYLNTNEIRSFQSRTDDDLTLINLAYGTMLVKETPEELFKMVGGN